MSKKLDLKRMLSTVMLCSVIAPGGLTSRAMEGGSEPKNSSSSAPGEQMDINADESEVVSEDEKIYLTGGQWVEIPDSKIVGMDAAMKAASKLIKEEVFGGEADFEEQIGGNDSDVRLRGLLISMFKNFVNVCGKDVIGVSKGKDERGFFSWSSFDERTMGTFSLLKDEVALNLVKTNLPQIIKCTKLCTHQLNFRQQKNPRSFKLSSGVSFSFEEYARTLSELDRLLIGLPNFVELHLRNELYNHYITSSIHSSLFAKYADMKSVSADCRNYVINSFEKLKKHWTRRLDGLKRITAERTAGNAPT